MDWKIPTAFAMASSLVLVISVPPFAQKGICEADSSYRHIPCDTPSLVVVSTSVAASWSDTLKVAENVTGELRQAPTPEAKFRQYVELKIAPDKNGIKE